MNLLNPIFIGGGYFEVNHCFSFVRTFVNTCVGILLEVLNSSLPWLINVPFYLEKFHMYIYMYIYVCIQEYTRVKIQAHIIPQNAI